MSKSHKSPQATEPVATAEPVVETATIRSAYAAALEARTAATAEKQQAIRAFSRVQNAATASGLKAAQAALANAEEDCRALAEVLESVEANEEEAARLAALAATAELRAHCAAKAQQIALVQGKAVEAAGSVLRDAISDLQRAASGLHEDVGRAINGLALHEDARDDLRALLGGRSSAAGPAASASMAGLVKGLVSSWGGDLGLWIEIHQARTGGSLVSALLDDARVIASRLGTKLPVVDKASK